MLEYHFQKLIQVIFYIFDLTFSILECSFFIVAFCMNITKKLTGENKESFLLYKTFTSLFCFFIAHTRIIKCLVSCFPLTFIYISSEIFRNVTIKHCTKDIIFKVPSIYGTTEFICNGPDCTMQFFSFLFFLIIYWHNCIPFHLSASALLPL